MSRQPQAARDYRRYLQQVPKASTPSTPTSGCGNGAMSDSLHEQESAAQAAACAMNPVDRLPDVLAGGCGSQTERGCSRRCQRPASAPPDDPDFHDQLQPCSRSATLSPSLTSHPRLLTDLT